VTDKTEWFKKKKQREMGVRAGQEAECRKLATNSTS